MAFTLQRPGMKVCPRSCGLCIIKRALSAAGGTRRLRLLALAGPPGDRVNPCAEPGFSLMTADCNSQQGSGTGHRRAERVTSHNARRFRRGRGEQRVPGHLRVWLARLSSARAPGDPYLARCAGGSPCSPPPSPPPPRRWPPLPGGRGAAAAPVPPVSGWWL